LYGDPRFSQDLVGRVKIAIRTQLSARHLPSIILETKAIPVGVYECIKNVFLCSFVYLLIVLIVQYTLSGKKVEVAVKQIISGEDVGNRGALANPESLDLYSNIPALRPSGIN
jgi:acetoacetyl-CoA synthetase